MKNTIFILLLFIGANLLAQNNKFNKVNIIENDIKIESRYIDYLNKVNSIILFNEKNIITDSLAFYYTFNNKRIKKIIDFTFNENKIKINKNSYLKNRIFDIYNEDTLCKHITFIKNRFLLEEFVYNICNIVNSSLYDGRDMKEIVNIKQESDKTIFEFDNLDSRFNLIGFINSYFYNEILNKYSYEVSNGNLIKEEYIFHNGIFTINYNYNHNNILQNITAFYNKNNEDSIKIERKYIIEDIK